MKIWATSHEDITPEFNRSAMLIMEKKTKSCWQSDRETLRFFPRPFIFWGVSDYSCWDWISMTFKIWCNWIRTAAFLARISWEILLLWRIVSRLLKTPGNWSGIPTKCTPREIIRRWEFTTTEIELGSWKTIFWPRATHQTKSKGTN